jgi:shikimate kinase
MASIETTALIGLKHVGKSTIGSYVARRLDRRFDDLDDLLVQEYLKETVVTTDGIPVTPREIYRYSATLFRHMEYRALVVYFDNLSEPTRPDGRFGILATGGGVCDNDGAFSILTERTTTVFLDESIGVLYRRIITKGIPAFLDMERPEEHFREIAESRRAVYLAAADYVIPTNGLTPSAVGDAIIELIR